MGGVVDRLGFLLSGLFRLFFYVLAIVPINPKHWWGWRALMFRREFPRCSITSTAPSTKKKAPKTP